MVSKIVLPNGVRIVCEKLTHVRSASCGIWVESGSRGEPAALAGVSHFIEHMVFKGTASRTAEDIAREMDAIGGRVNAFTTKECTCFYLKALDSHLRTGLDVLCDMFFNARFDEADVELEKGVILEEIGMYEDAPDDLVVERNFQTVFRGSPLARPVLGGKKTVSALTGAVMRDYMKSHYAPENTVVALSGSFRKSDVSYLIRLFGRMRGERPKPCAPAFYRPADTAKTKRLEQNHRVITYPGVSFSDPRRYAVQLLSSALGGGMSSRLFQELREKRGLCYSVYTFLTGHDDVGLFSVYTATNKETEAEALEIIRRELARVKAAGVTKEELSRVREQHKANLLMGLESISSRMNHLARSEMIFHRDVPVEELIAGYDAVTEKDMLRVANELLRDDMRSTSVVGRLK